MAKSEAIARKVDAAELTAQPEAAAQMFERLARDPNASVEKIERLMALWERGEAQKAATAFNVALVAAQTEIRRVAADADNPQTRSRYASYAALDRALRPIYTSHGFALSFNTGDTTLTDHVRVLCDVRHVNGHLQPYHLDVPADGKGAKGGDVMTKTHAAASAISYGMRYLLRMIFNVAIGEDDDDGNRAGGKVQPTKPAPRPTPATVPSQRVTVSKDRISDAQRRRMFTIMKRVHRPEDELRAWLDRRYQIQSTKDIPKDLYEAICAAIEAPGVLPEREPGE